MKVLHNNTSPRNTFELDRVTPRGSKVKVNFFFKWEHMVNGVSLESLSCVEFNDTNLTLAGQLEVGQRSSLMF